MLAHFGGSLHTLEEWQVKILGNINFCKVRYDVADIRWNRDEMRNKI